MTLAKPAATLLEFTATFVADPKDAIKLEGAITGIFSKVGTGHCWPCMCVFVLTLCPGAGLCLRAGALCMSRGSRCNPARPL